MTHLKHKLSARRFIGIRSTCDELGRAVPAEYANIVLAFVCAATLQLAEFSMSATTGPVDSLKKKENVKEKYLWLQVTIIIDKKKAEMKSNFDAQ